MKKKIFLRIAAAAACAVAFFVNVSINGNNAAENNGTLTIGESAKAECNEGSVIDGMGICTGTRCYHDIVKTDCDTNS